MLATRSLSKAGLPLVAESVVLRDGSVALRRLVERC